MLNKEDLSQIQDLLTAAFTKQNAYLDTRFDRMEKRMDSLEARISSLEDRVSGLEEEMQEVKQDLAEIKVTLEQVQAATLETLSQIQVYGDRLEIQTMQVKVNADRIAVVERMAEFS